MSGYSKEKAKILLKRYNEVILYLVFGVLTTIISIFTYGLLTETFFVNELLANIVSWIISVTFAFFTNRIWVFQAQTSHKARNVRQFLSFYFSRLATLFVEEMLIYIFVTKLRWNNWVVKTAAQFLVIVLNYALSKWFVFRKENEKKAS